MSICNNETGGCPAFFAQGRPGNTLLQYLLHDRHQHIAGVVEFVGAGGESEQPV